jgi:hypothetical protein
MNNYYASLYDSAEDFNEMLRRSQASTKNTRKIMSEHGFHTEPADEIEIQRAGTIIKVRGLDTHAFGKGMSFHSDDKDWARLAFYLATGMPLRRFLLYMWFQSESGSRTSVFFRDNTNWERDTLKKSDFKQGGLFLPYGGWMDSMELFHKQDIPCRFDRRDPRQIIWKYRPMLSLPDFLSTMSPDDVSDLRVNRRRAIEAVVRIHEARQEPLPREWEEKRHEIGAFTHISDITQPEETIF